MPFPLPCLSRLAGVLSLAIASALMAAPPAKAAPASPDTTAQTRYPIVLVHGFMGFDSLLGVDYWYQIPQALRTAGAKVYVAEVSQLNSNTVRGEQLLQQIKGWAARDGFAKVNLIGHSQGGPTARYVAGMAPQLVASITTVASPHTISAEDASNNAVGELISQHPDFTVALAKTVALLSGRASNPQDISAFSGNFADELATFNQRFPDGQPTTPCGEGPEVVKGIYYYSASGSKGKTNSWDISDMLMVDKPDNDGIVPRCASHWGKVLRDDYPWNHLDEINQLFGLIGKGAPDPVAFYVQHASRLKNKGL
jgi:triacylglycerol lipase